MFSKFSLVAISAMSVAVVVADKSASTAFARGGAGRGSRSVSRATIFRGPSTYSYRSSTSFSRATLGGWHGSPSRPSLNTATASQVMQTFSLQPAIGPPNKGPTSQKGPGRWVFNLGGANKTLHASKLQVGVGPGVNLGSSASKTSRTSNLVGIPVKPNTFAMPGSKTPARGLAPKGVQPRVNEQTIPRADAYKVNWKKPPHIFGGGVWHPWWERL